MRTLPVVRSEKPRNITITAEEEADYVIKFFLHLYDQVDGGPEQVINEQRILGRLAKLRKINYAAQTKLHTQSGQRDRSNFPVGFDPDKSLHLPNAGV